MSRIESTKLGAVVATGSPSNAASVSKVMAYVLLVPGDDGSTDETARQGYCYAQKIRRR